MAKQSLKWKTQLQLINQKQGKAPVRLLETLKKNPTLMMKKDMGPVWFTWRFWKDRYLAQAFKTWRERLRYRRIGRLWVSNEVGKWEFYEIWAYEKMRGKIYGKWVSSMVGRWVLGVVRKWKREKEFSKSFRQHVFFLFFVFLEKPINVAVDMDVDEGNLGTEKVVSTKCTKPILMVDSQIFQFLGFENHIIYKWVSQNTRFPSIFPCISTYFFNFLSNFLCKKTNLNR